MADKYHPTPNELITAQTYFLSLLSNTVVGGKTYEAALWRAYLAAREDVAREKNAESNLIKRLEDLCDIAMIDLGLGEEGREYDTTCPEDTLREAIETLSRKETI
jgi:hypothetical protein